MSDNGNGDGKKSELPKGLEESTILKMAGEYAKTAKIMPDDAEKMLGLFGSVVGKYIMETFAIDPARLRFQRVLLMVLGMLRAAYAMGATKGLPEKKEG